MSNNRTLQYHLNLTSLSKTKQNDVSAYRSILSCVMATMENIGFFIGENLIQNKQAYYRAVLIALSLRFQFPQESLEKN